MVVLVCMPSVEACKLFTVREVKEHHRDPECGRGVAELIACQVQGCRKPHYVRVLEPANQYDFPTEEEVEHITHIEQDLVSAESGTKTLAYLKQMHRQFKTPRGSHVVQVTEQTYRKFIK